MVKVIMLSFLKVYPRRSLSSWKLGRGVPSR